MPFLYGMISLSPNSFIQFLTAATFLQHAVQKVTCEEAYVTYHNYNDDTPLTSTSCSDGANGLITKFGYWDISPMAPYVAATSISPWNSPNCGNCYALTSGGVTVYVTAIDLCGAAPNGGMHFDMHPVAFTELLGSAGIAAGSAYVTYTEADPSNCRGNLNGGGGGNDPTPTPTPRPTPMPTPRPTSPTNSGSSGCPAIPQNELPSGAWATSDYYCEPCANGQSWWPCNKNPPICECMREDNSSPTHSPTPGPTAGSPEDPSPTPGPTPGPTASPAEDPSLTPGPTAPPTEEDLDISDATPCCPYMFTGLRAWNQCTQFYHCHNGNVIGDPIDVPSGLLFDQRIQNHVYPYQLQECIQENCNRRREMLRGRAN